MANKYIRTTGGNWSVASTWASTNGGTDTVTVPGASDIVYGTSISGNLTINANATCSDIVFTGYAGVLTLNSGIDWTTVSGWDFVFPATCTLSGTGRVVVGANIATMNTNGLVCPWELYSFAATTVSITLTGDSYFSGLVSLGRSSQTHTLAGSYNLVCSGGLTLTSGTLSKGTGSPVIKVTNGNIAGTGTSNVPLDIDAGANTVSFTANTVFDGGITYTSGTINCSTAPILVGSSVGTIANNFPTTAIFRNNATMTMTFGGAMNIGGIVAKTGTVLTLAGGYDHTLGKVEVESGATLKGVNGRTINTQIITSYGTPTSPAVISSDSAGNTFSLNYTGSLSTMKIVNTNFTDVTATTTCCIFVMFSGTLSNTTNIEVHDLSTIGNRVVTNVTGVI